MNASCNWVNLLQVSSVQFICYEEALMPVIFLFIAVAEFVLSLSYEILYIKV